MKRLAYVLVGGLLGFGALLVPSTSAFATTTTHGVWTSAVGVNGENPAWGDELVGTGTYNVNEGPHGTQITGVVFITHAPCKSSVPPCQFNLPLSVLEWRGSNGSYTAEFGGETTFALTLTLSEDGATLDVEITNCPFHWQSWTITGTNMT